MAQIRQALSRIAEATRSHLTAAGLGLLVTLPLPALAQTQPATLMADQVFVDSAGRLVAQGAVEIWHGSIRLTAQRVSFDQRQDWLEIAGPITLSNGPDQVILADAAELAPSLRAGIITGARVVLEQQMQISAARIERGTNGVSQMDAVIASSCPVCASNPTPLWEIRAQRVRHDEANGRLEFERAQFRFAGVPVFYAPRLNLPAPGVTRAPGLLRPEISLDSDLGLSIGLPYFIPLGESQDLTLTPRASTNGMVSLGFRWRMARQNGGIELGGQLSHDNLVTDELRGYGYVRALFALGNHWTLTADLLAASDRTYLETYNISDDSRLHGHATLERITRDQAARLRLLGFYSLRPTDVNDRLPNAVTEASLEQHHGIGGGDLTVDLGARAFWRQSSLDGIAGRDVARAHLALGWRRSAILAGGIVATGALQGRIDHVRVPDDTTYPDPVNRRVLQGMVELRWPLARVSDGGVRHVVEPVVQVISAQRRGGALPNDDHTMPELDAGNLFALTRYVGEDAPDDGSRVNAGLRWARHDPSGWTSETLVGRIWRRVPLGGFDPLHEQPLGDSSSDWLLAGRLSNSDGLSLTARLLLDPEDTALRRAETNLAWHWDRTRLSTTYLFLPASTFEDRAVDLAEWSVDLTRQFESGWATTLGWDYDFGQNIFAAARTGFTFSNECLSLDMTLARHFVTATNPSASTRFDLRIELLGIGGRAPSTGGRTCRT
ncbi:LPS-assembly protein LptD [Pararhodobacter sp.]|uniref:LPS-assembly protein LptD n=1 Tax=Pararhodobacter sp. TaxID=2127056 RepID=UPI002FDF7031